MAHGAGKCEKNSSFVSHKRASSVDASTTQMPVIAYFKALHIDLMLK
jgi:hypothetical protein